MRCTPEKGEISKKKNIQAGAELNQAQQYLGFGFRQVRMLYLKNNLG